MCSAFPPCISSIPPGAWFAVGATELCEEDKSWEVSGARISPAPPLCAPGQGGPSASSVWRAEGAYSF